MRKKYLELLNKCESNKKRVELLLSKHLVKYTKITNQRLINKVSIYNFWLREEVKLTKEEFNSLQLA